MRNKNSTTTRSCPAKKAATSERLFTDVFTKNAIPENGRDTQIFIDTVSYLLLRVVIGKKGAARYWMRRGKKGEPKEVSLKCKVGDVLLADARQLAGYRPEFAHLSAPPAAPEPIEESTLGYKAVTLLKAVENYLTGHALKTETIKTNTTYKKFISNNYIEIDEVLTLIGDIKLGDIKTIIAKKIVDAVYRQPGKTKTPSAAKKLIGLCSSAFKNETEYEEDAVGNPFDRIKETSNYKREIGNAPKESGRALTPDEIKIMWHELNTPNGAGTPPTVRALFLMLVTGMRNTEVTDLHTREIAKPDKNGDVWWTLPAERIKTNTVDTKPEDYLPHDIYLTPLALRIIGDEKGFVFKNSKREDAPIDKKSPNKLVKRRKRLGMERWTPHDIRRTVETLLDNPLDCPSKYFNAMLNHAKDKTYNKNEYKEGKKLWWQRWSDYIEEIIGSEQAMNIRHEDPPKYDLVLLQKLVAEGQSKRAVGVQLGGISETRVRQLCAEYGIKSKAQLAAEVEEKRKSRIRQTSKA